VAERGGRIKDIFFCPHHPEDHCRCRKPATGMLQQAAAKYGLDLSHTILVGDSAKDIQCARAAGCGRAVLVATGNGRSAMETLARRGQSPDHTADNLLEAAPLIETQLPALKRRSPGPPPQNPWKW
jgi:D-glycero-D-manno-heptose 1,7-bisphosphate phosphatase